MEMVPASQITFLSRDWRLPFPCLSKSLTEIGDGRA
jgi:hypothetical protein